MSDDSPDDSPDLAGTLYDPGPASSESDVPSAEDDDEISLRLSLPPERAERLRSVAQQLGLTPALVAKRAIELVCDEVVTIQEDPRPRDSLIEQYQTRLDLLHSLGSDNEEGEPPTEAE